MSIHFIGVDAGGTQTRALLADEAGEVAGVGHAAGANSWSSGTPVPEVIGAAMTGALHGTDPRSVADGVIAIAGGGATSPQIAAEIGKVWRDLDLPGAPHIVLDVLAAFAAGTAQPRGIALAAGTGAIAALVDDGQVQRRAGGHGWLVGDEGSAVWLGVRSIEAALKVLDGRGPQTTLARVACKALGVDEADDASTAVAIVTATYSRPPAQLGQLAPLVITAAEQGDAVAQDLIDTAADELASITAAVAAGERPPVIVLAGSLLTRAALVRRLVRERLAERWPKVPVAEASSGEAGAIALAIKRHTGERLAEAALDRLRGTA